MFLIGYNLQHFYLKTILQNYILFYVYKNYDTTIYKYDNYYSNLSLYLSTEYLLDNNYHAFRVLNIEPMLNNIFKYLNEFHQ